MSGIPPSAQIVLIGEGTHGTDEFFRIRMEVTQCLLENHGFRAIVCEGDAQPFFELNEIVTYEENGNDIRSLLSQLFCNRFPGWMWSNVPMAEFITWLRRFNADAKKPTAPIQILGMDIQSPISSMEYITQQLTGMGENELAKQMLGCYQPLFEYRDNLRRYGTDVFGNKVASQASAVKKALDLLQQTYESQRSSNAQEIDIWFRLIQNSHAVVVSEAYHRQRTYPGHTTTWNLRTEAFLHTIQRAMEYCGGLTAARKETDGNPLTKLVVWAHNSHVGDMRATGYSQLGQISLGQLCRETFGEDRVFLIGMSTHEGTVRAAHADPNTGACWRGKGEVMQLRKAKDESHESALHSMAKNVRSFSGEQAFGICLRGMQCDDVDTAGASGIEQVSFNCIRPERFVGSCYLPQTEMMSHYSNCNLDEQFDYVLHVDESSAIAD